MSFGTMMEILKKRNKGKILLVKLGAFYIAIENDAVLLHNKLDLKCLCYKNNTCKVGIPVNSIGKYIEKLNEIGYSYIIYDFLRDKQELKVVAQKKLKNNKETEKNLNCLLCKGTGAYSKESDYLVALEKLYRKDEND